MRLPRLHPVDVPTGEQPPASGRTQATSLEYLRLIAVARLFFDNVNHLQSSWLTTGKDVGQLSLHMGVDDLGSIMLEENVISSAGARHRSNLHELIWLIRSAGRIPAQRDTLYRHLRVHHTPADDPTDDRVRSHVSSIAMPSRTCPSCQPREQGRMSRASLRKEPHEVAAMFDGVAKRYDRTNTILSFGRDRSWRRSTRAALGAPGRGAVPRPRRRAPECPLRSWPGPGASWWARTSRWACCRSVIGTADRTAAGR